MNHKKVLEGFYEIISEHKIELFNRVASERTKHITLGIENIFQEHNASAVLRTCDCFGIQDLHVIEKNNEFAINRDIALGAGRWIDVYNYGSENPSEDCMKHLKNKGYKIVATTPHTDSYTINDIPLERPLAFFFGTEQEGLSTSVLKNADYTVKIPMFGFTESFNISVSVAILLNTLRKRLEDSKIEWKLSELEQTILKIEWCKKILKSGDALENEFKKQLLKKDL